MKESKIALSNSNWSEQIKEVERLLEVLRPKLIEAEAELADRLAAINAFEYKIRSRLGTYLKKLELLDEEIQSFRKKLQWLGEKWDDQEEDFWKMGSSATEEGEYRYRQEPAEKRSRKLSTDETKELKKLYRELARRFHPDMAVDEPDRDYRTQLMMAINAAYAAGDLERLQEISLEPDSVQAADVSDNEQLKTEARQRELARIHRRLREIKQELTRLDETNTSKMMRQATVLASEGLNFFEEKTADLREQIAYKKVERDSLQTQLESFEADVTFTGDAFADAVWHVSLEHSLDDNSGQPNFDRYIQKRQDNIYFEEDFDDDVDFE